MDYITDLEIRASSCTACLGSEKRRQPLVGSGPYKSPIMVVTNWPNSTDDKKGKLLQGRRGQALRKLLTLGRLRVENLFFTPIVKCYTARLPPDYRENNAPSKCRAFLYEQIRVSKPLAIILIGPTALKWALFPDTNHKVDKFRDWVGKICIRPDKFGQTKFLILEDPLEHVGREGEQRGALCNRAIHKLREYVVAVLDNKDEIPLLDIRIIEPIHKKTYADQELFGGGTFNV